MTLKSVHSCLPLNPLYSVWWSFLRYSLQWFSYLSAVGNSYWIPIFFNFGRFFFFLSSYLISFVINNRAIQYEQDDEIINQLAFSSLPIFLRMPVLVQISILLCESIVKQNDIEIREQLGFSCDYLQIAVYNSVLYDEKWGLQTKLTNSADFVIKAK